MNTEAIDRLIDNVPSLATSREALEAMQEGAYCIHRSWGFGKITGFDPARGDHGMLVIDFDGEERKGHAMDPVFCLGKLEVLKETHILARHRENTEEIELMAKKEPVELIMAILSECDNECATNREIERLLQYLFEPSKAKKWWTNAKKLLVRDPRVAVPTKKTEPYVLRDEPVNPEQEILQDFFDERRSKEKILLAEKLFDLSSEKEDLQEDLPKVLEELTVAITEARNLNQADRLYGIWVRNNLARNVEEDAEKIEPTSASILSQCEDNLPELAEQMPAKFHRRFLDLVTRVYPENWKKVLLDKLLQHTTTKFSGEAAHFLIDQGEEALLGKSLVRWLDEQKIKGPVLLWMLKFRKLSKFEKLLQPLITPRILGAVFSAIDHESLLNASTRRIPLAEILGEDRELIPDILASADAETAKDLAQALLLNPGFDDLNKRSLLARFIKLFPAIQELVDGSGETSFSSQSTESTMTETLIVSQESLDFRLTELEKLNNERIPENSAAIETAREHGDLRENAEYQMAKDEQKTLLARQGELQVDLARAQATDFSEAPADSVGIGSVVNLHDQASGEHQVYSILGAWDSDPENNILSYQTPLAQSLMGKKEGEDVSTEIDGVSHLWRVESVGRWVDRA